MLINMEQYGMYQFSAIYKLFGTRPSNSGERREGKVRAKKNNPLKLGRDGASLSFVPIPPTPPPPLSALAIYFLLCVAYPLPAI